MELGDKTESHGRVVRLDDVAVAVHQGADAHVHRLVGLVELLHLVAQARQVTAGAAIAIRFDDLRIAGGPDLDAAAWPVLAQFRGSLPYRGGFSRYRLWWRRLASGRGWGCGLRAPLWWPWRYW